MVISVKYPLVSIPIAELIENDQLQAAITQRDLQLQEIAELNKLFVPCSSGSHNIISDCLNRIINPADGKAYDSKSKYYQTLKDKGCHVLESGNVSKRQEADHNVRKELTIATREILNRRS